MKNIAKYVWVALVFAALMLAGCTVNPQDLASKTGAGNGILLAQANGTVNGTANGSSGLLLTMAEVAKHNSASDCWMVINNNVLDLSNFIGHPGGSTYVPYCGTDASAVYAATGHSYQADVMMKNYEIGVLGQIVNMTGATAVQTQPSNATYRSENYYGDDYYGEKKGDD